RAGNFFVGRRFQPNALISLDLCAARWTGAGNTWVLPLPLRSAVSTRGEIPSEQGIFRNLAGNPYLPILICQERGATERILRKRYFIRVDNMRSSTQFTHVSLYNK